MNTAGVSFFTPTFMLNIISVAHRLPVKTLEDETADLVRQISTGLDLKDI